MQEPLVAHCTDGDDLKVVLRSGNLMTFAVSPVVVESLVNSFSEEGISTTVSCLFMDYPPVEVLTLLHGHTFGKVARTIDVNPPLNPNVIGKEM